MTQFGPTVKWLERGILFFIRKICKPGAPGCHPAPIWSWSAWVWSWYRRKQSQETEPPGLGEIFELPNVAGLEASFNIFKYWSQLISFFFLKSIWMEFPITYTQKSTTTHSRVYRPHFTDVKLELQDDIICPRPPSFKLRSVSLQGWSVLSLRNHLPTSVPCWLCPKLGVKVHHLVSECKSVILLDPRPKTLVGHRQEEKKHFLEQIDGLSIYS